MDKKITIKFHQVTYFILLCFSLINLSCTNTAGSISPQYMHTGFYFLAEEKDGIKMKIEGSGEIYTISKNPFASVNNIAKTELRKNKLDDNTIITSLCMTFDNKGTKDIESNTGNPLHPKVAVIIANKLFYVFDNNAKFSKGIMCVILENLSGQEMIELKKKVDEKN